MTTTIRADEYFSKALQMLESGEAPSQHSLLIYQSGSLLLEKYWSGQDGKRGFRTFGPDDLHDIRSCTKSVIGLLVGIAIDRNILPSADQPIYTLYPDLFASNSKKPSPEHRLISIEHLLLMTDGIAWNQDEGKLALLNNEFWLDRSKDRASYVWSRPIEKQPGERFNYNSGATTLLGGALERVVGEDVETYASKCLFSPLGITDWEWMKWGAHSPSAYGGLRLKPNDMLKLGKLVLQEGKWKGKQLISKEWIHRLSDQKEGRRQYGYQWWLDQYEVNDLSIRSVAAGGKGGQYIHVFPSLNAVVVFTAGHYDDSKSAGPESFEFLTHYILPELIKNNESSH